MHTCTQLIGLALIAGGAYLIASGSNLSFLTGNGIASGAAIIIICGVVTLVITGIGLLGAFGLWRPLLVIVSEKKWHNSSLINSRVFDHCSLLCICHSLVPSLSTPGLAVLKEEVCEGFPPDISKSISTVTMPQKFSLF